MSYTFKKKLLGYHFSGKTNGYNKRAERQVLLLGKY